MENSIRNHFRERLKKARPCYIADSGRNLPAKHVGGRLLEIGCGARFTYRTAGLELYGLDITTEMLPVLKTRFPTCNVVLGDSRELPFRDKAFDIVVFSFLLHHLVHATPKGCVINMHVALQEAVRVMKDRGIAYVREVMVYNKIISHVLFYLTALCAKLHISLDFLEMRSDVVTFFLTEKMFRKLCANLRLEKLSWKEWKFWFLGKSGVEFSLAKKLSEIN